ncbi:MAG: transcriptional repressor [Proteiniphilum sp.]|jgi:Fur family ferric uptake transcriptional regulator|nr:transcriptional repressor [Proteiniphilum sp.]
MTVEELLQARGLKNTGCRKYILGELLKRESAMSETELKESYPNLFDRVTLYRTLKTLEDRGIIHRIVLCDNSVKYALNRNHHEGSAQHTHFHCGKCDEVLCLKGTAHFDAELPKGFVLESVIVTIEGVCAACMRAARPRSVKS